MRKACRGWWDRLIAQERKPVFLTPDFDRWLDESDAEMEIREKVSITSWILSERTVVFGHIKGHSISSLPDGCFGYGVS